MVTLDQIRKRLQEAIRQSGISQTALAKRIGIGQQTISEYLHGKSMPALDSFANLCKVLDVSADYLLCLDDYGIVNYNTQEFSMGQDEAKLLDDYRQLNAASRAKLQGYMQGLLSAPRITTQKS